MGSTVVRIEALLGLPPENVKLQWFDSVLNSIIAPGGDTLLVKAMPTVLLALRLPG